MKTTLALVLLAGALALPAPVRAEVTRRALVVGIDAYGGGGGGITTGDRQFTPLFGAVADANAVAALLRRLGFDVTLLTDAAATRRAIETGLAALAAGANPGDVRVFYYAGHGSRVRNTLSPERDQLDESIVPVDTGTLKDGQEVRDLRDKELAAAFDAILAKLATLTVLYDSCHSGGAARGKPPELVGRPRQAAWDERDVKDGSRPVPPETLGALVLAAAQDEQVAQEMGTPARGVFTRALVAELERPGALALPARALFLRVEAAVRQATRDGQIPVLAGLTRRQRATLLDGRPVSAVEGLTVRVWWREGRLVAESPPLVPLGAGTVLEAGDGSAPVRLVVGEGQVAPGVVPVAPPAGDRGNVVEAQPFRVARWVMAREGMKLHVPRPASPSQLEAARKAASALRAEMGVEVVDEPVGATYRLEGLATDGGLEWMIFGPCVDVDANARGPNAAKLVRRVLARSGACGARPPRPTIFVLLPPPEAIAAALRTAWTVQGAPVKLVEFPGDAVYAMAGRVEGAAIGYALVRTASAPAAMPSRTDFVRTAAGAGGAAAAGAQLEDLGARLSQTFAWLSQAGSDADAQAAFPYELVLRPMKGGTGRGDGAVLIDGEAFGFALRRSAEVATVERRWIYVFGLDSLGRRLLVFPRPELGNVENRLPLTADATAGAKAPAPPELVLLEHAFDVTAPYGTDTIFLLAATEQLFDPLSLEDDGVRTRGERRSDEPDEVLLRGMAPRRMTTRSAVPRWSLTKVTVTSRAR